MKKKLRVTDGPANSVCFRAAPMRLEEESLILKPYAVHFFTDFDHFGPHLTENHSNFLLLHDLSGLPEISTPNEKLRPGLKCSSSQNFIKKKT